jgi:hypothetical protein
MTSGANDRWALGRRRIRAAEMPGARIRGVALLTGWGDGVDALGLPEVGAARGLVPVPTPALEDNRFRRVTRECLLSVMVVRKAVADGGFDATALAGDRTGLIYVSATAYAAANRAFLEDESSTPLHFPYTAPSAVPGEATIEFGIRGPYVTLMGGGATTLAGLWYAARWLARGVADRVVILAVEAMQEVGDLFARARRLYDGPLVEGAACLILEPGDGPVLRWSSITTPRGLVTTGVADVLDAVLQGVNPRSVASCVRGHAPGRAERHALGARGIVADPTVPTQLGETLACGPLIGLAHARALGLEGPCLLTAAWRGEYGAALWPL